MSIESRMAARTVKAELQRLVKVAKHQELTLLKYLLENALDEANIQCQTAINNDLKSINGLH